MKKIKRTEEVKDNINVKDREKRTFEILYRIEDKSICLYFEEEGVPKMIKKIFIGMINIITDILIDKKDKIDFVIVYFNKNEDHLIINVIKNLYSFFSIIVLKVKDREIFLKNIKKVKVIFCIGENWTEVEKMKKVLKLFIIIKIFKKEGISTYSILIIV